MTERTVETIIAELPDNWSGVFVRRVEGMIRGVFARPQLGLAEEPLAVDDPEVVAFRNGRPGRPGS